MTMGKRKKKGISRMGNQMEYGLNGIGMDRRVQKEITGMGKATIWHENGQKSDEVTYKDGELISEKCWDEDGNECECRAFSSGCY